MPSANSGGCSHLDSIEQAILLDDENILKELLLSQREISEYVYRY